MAKKPSFEPYQTELGQLPMPLVSGKRLLIGVKEPLTREAAVDLAQSRLNYFRERCARKEKSKKWLPEKAALIKAGLIREPEIVAGNPASHSAQGSQ